MNKIIAGLKSRTVWTAFVMFLINTIPMISEVLPEQWKAFANSVLGLLVFYFRVTPSRLS